MDEHSFEIHYSYPVSMLLKMFDDYKLHLYAWNNPPMKNPIITVYGSPDNIKKLRETSKNLKSLPEGL